MKRIEIDLGNGKRLVAEANTDNNYKEIYVGIETIENPVWIQDLAIVRQAYNYGENDEVIPVDSKMDVLVFGDVNTEDYTDVFTVDILEDIE